jgi:hypothetical protein
MFQRGLCGEDRHFEGMPRSLTGHDLDSEKSLAWRNATAHHFRNGKHPANYGGASKKYSNSAREPSLRCIMDACQDSHLIS